MNSTTGEVVLVQELSSSSSRTDVPLLFRLFRHFFIRKTLKRGYTALANPEEGIPLIYRFSKHYCFNSIKEDPSTVISFLLFTASEIIQTLLETDKNNFKI